MEGISSLLEVQVEKEVEGWTGDMWCSRRVEWSERQEHITRHGNGPTGRLRGIS